MTADKLLPLSRIRLRTARNSWRGRLNKGGRYISDGHTLMAIKQVAPEILVSLISRAGWYKGIMPNAKAAKLFRAYKSRASAQVQVFCSGYLRAWPAPRAVFQTAQAEPVFDIDAQKLRLFIAATGADTFYADSGTPVPALAGYRGRRCVGVIAALRPR